MHPRVARFAYVGVPEEVHEVVFCKGALGVLVRVEAVSCGEEFVACFDVVGGIAAITVCVGWWGGAAPHGDVAEVDGAQFAGAQEAEVPWSCEGFVCVAELVGEEHVVKVEGVVLVSAFALFAAYSFGACC